MIIIHFIALFTFILLIFFFLNFFFLFPYFHMLLYYLFFLLNSNIFIVIFTRDWFICFLDVIVYFLFIVRRFATLMSTELSVIFLYMFCYMSHTHAYSFSCGFWQLWFPELHLHTLCLISFYIFLSSCSSSTFNLSSLFTSVAFSELSFILRTPNFCVHILFYY